SWVVDPEPLAGGATFGLLFRVDPTGGRTLLSDFGDATQGPLGFDPVGVAIDAPGHILVADQDAGTGAAGALVRGDRTTGHRTLISDFGDSRQGPLGFEPVGVAIDAAGTIWVIDQGALFQVDRATGHRTLISDFGDSRQGPLGANPKGVAIAATGTILVTTFNSGAL